MLPQTEQNARETEHDIHRLMEAIASITRRLRLEMTLAEGEKQPPQVAVEYEQAPAAEVPGIAVEHEQRLPELEGFNPELLAATDRPQLSGSDYLEGQLLEEPEGLPGTGNLKQLVEVEPDLIASQESNLSQGVFVEDALMPPADLFSSEAEAPSPTIDLKIGEQQLSGSLREVSQQIEELSPEQRATLKEAISQPQGTVIEGEAVSISVDGTSVLERDAQGQMQVNEIEAELSQARSYATDADLLPLAASAEADAPQTITHGEIEPTQAVELTESVEPSQQLAPEPELTTEPTVLVAAVRADPKSPEAELVPSVEPVAVVGDPPAPPETSTPEPAFAELPEAELEVEAANNSEVAPEVAEAHLQAVQADIQPDPQPRLAVLPIGELEGLTGVQLNDCDSLDGAVAAQAPSAVVMMSADGKVVSTSDLRQQVEATEDKIQSGELATEHADQAEAQALTPEASMLISGLQDYFSATGEQTLEGGDYRFEQQGDAVLLFPLDGGDSIRIADGNVDPAIDPQQYEQLMDHFSASYDRVQVSQQEAGGYEQEYELA